MMMKVFEYVRSLYIYKIVGDQETLNIECVYKHDYNIFLIWYNL